MVCVLATQLCRGIYVCERQMHALRYRCAYIRVVLFMPRDLTKAHSNSGLEKTELSAQWTTGCEPCTTWIFIRHKAVELHRSPPAADVFIAPPHMYATSGSLGWSYSSLEVARFSCQSRTVQTTPLISVLPPIGRSKKTIHWCLTFLYTWWYTSSTHCLP